MVSQLDVTATGDVTVLYAGNVNGNYTGDIVQGIITDDRQSIRALNKTQAFWFLDQDNQSLDDALRQIFGDDPSVRGTDSNKFLFGESDNDTGKRLIPGAWDNISGRFASETVGEVRVLAGKPRIASVLYQTELPVLVDKLLGGSGVITGVNGVSASDLAFVLDVPEAERFTVLRNTLLLSGITQTLAANPTLDRYAKFFSLSSDNFSAEFKLVLGTESVGDLFKNIGLFSLPVSSTSYLNKLGPIGWIVGFSLMATQANAAVVDGRPDDAKDIVALWLIDLSASAVTEITIAALGAMAAVSAGVVAAPVAGAMVLGATLAGGFFAGDAATDMYKRLQNLDESGKKEFLDQLAFVIFGDYVISELQVPADLEAGNRLDLSINFTVEDIISNAKTSIAWRYALVNLNTFVIDGSDSLYAKHNLNGELDIEGLSDQYFADRAEMLYWRLQYDNEARISVAGATH